MTGVSFHDAPPQQDFSELVPHGTLAWAILQVRPFNLDQGLIETPSKSSEACFLDLQLIIEGGRWNKRHIFTRIGVAGSEKYINMGRSAVRAILETGRGAGPQNMNAYNLQADAQGRVNWMELNGLRIGIKIKIEPPQNGYQEKNDVAVWLSPLDAATAKDFERLVAGDTEPKAGMRVPAASAGQAPAKPVAAVQPWLQPQTAAPPGATAPAAPAKPGWVGNATAATAAPAGTPVPQAQPAAQPAFVPAWQQGRTTAAQGDEIPF